MSFSEIEKHWSGQGFILWKDPLNFPASISPASKGSHIRQLQGLLREAEAYSKPLTGVYDGDTLWAVKEFQSSKGIVPGRHRRRSNTDAPVSFHRSFRSPETYGRTKMSLILDALKKLDREKSSRRNGTANIAVEILRPDAPVPRKESRSISLSSPSRLSSLPPSPMPWWSFASCRNHHLLRPSTVLQ